MIKSIVKWIREHYMNIVGSIAFYPAIIAICFLALSWIMLRIDFSETGKSIKQNLNWLSLKDASTARSILSTVAGGIISLTVFSFSMVMIILNQAVSQMSNRLLNSMIGNRFQQIVLGFYIGTIVYALFLLTTIRDIQSGIYVPAISIYVLILFTITDIFLFIYFLDYVTKTVKYETIIAKVQRATLRSMQEKQEKISTGNDRQPAGEAFEVFSEETGYFQDFSTRSLVELAQQHNVVVEFLHAKGAHLLKGEPFMKVYGTITNSEDFCRELHLATDFYHGQPVKVNPVYGFRQLTEVAMRALSPGINDPGTAVIALNALADLLLYRMLHPVPQKIYDQKEHLRIVTKEKSFATLFTDSIRPIWNYGHEDYLIQQAMQRMIAQLQTADETGRHAALFSPWENEIGQARQKTSF